MLRDTEQRLTPVLVRRWALRCGGGLLLGAGICAAATGTAHADSTGQPVADLGSQARAAVASLLPATGESAAPVSQPTGTAPATRTVRITPPKPAAGKHRMPVLDGPARTAKHLLGDTLDSARGGVGTVTGKVSGQLRDAVGPGPSTRPGRPGKPRLAAGNQSRPVPAPPATAPAMPGAATPSDGRTPLVQLPGLTGMPQLPSIPRVLPQPDLAELLSGVGDQVLPAPGLPALQLPALQLPALQLPALQLPVLTLPELPGLPGLPGLPVLSGPGAGTTAPGFPHRAAAPGTSSTPSPSTTSQGLAGTASRHLSRVALPDAPSAPAAPQGPRPTGPVPALPAGTGAGAALHLISAWTEPAISAGHTPSGYGTLRTGFAGPAPGDRAGMPSITPD